MADDDDEDMYDEEFDFVDDDPDEEDSEVDEAEAEVDAGPAEVAPEESAERDDYEDVAEDAIEDVVEEEDPYATPPPAANYVVHIYEYRQFKRTIDRPFTGEDAEAFASEYNRTAKPYGRFAVAGKNDAKPHKNLDDRYET